MTQCATSTRIGNRQSRPEPVAGRAHPLKSLCSVAAIRICRRGEEICCEGCPADFWYRVVSGAARHCIVRADGRRQIIDLLLPGDFFGFTTTDRYGFTVEAATEGTKVASIPRRRTEAMADSDPQLAKGIRQVAFDALSRSRNQLVTLGRVTAVEKVGSFLLELATRSSNETDEKITLPISRYDIADYLAISVETVSRSLTSLKSRGLIKISGTRQVKIVDRDALDEAERDAHGHRFGG